MKMLHLGGLLLLGALWGASFLFIKIGVAEMLPETLVAMRLTLAAAVLLVVLYATGLRLPMRWQAWRDFAFTGVVGLVLPFLFISWGEQSIASGTASILNATTPLFTALIAYLWTRGEHLTGTKLLGVVLGFVGVVIAVGGIDFQLGDASTQGEIAVLLASICYGISGVYARKAFQNMPAMVPATGQLTCAALLFVPIALARHGIPTPLPSLKVLAAVTTLALVGTSIAYILLYWLIERIGSTRSSMVTYLVAPIALVYGAVFLREAITFNALIGLALVVVGILLANGLIGSSVTPHTEEVGARG